MVECKIRVAALAALAGALFAFAPTTGAHARPSSQGEFLIGAVEAVTRNYKEKITPDQLTQSLIQNINGGDGHTANLTACENSSAPQSDGGRRGWVDQIAAAIACSIRVRGEDQSDAALRISLVETLDPLGIHVMQKVRSWSKKDEYWAAIPLRPGLIGITLRAPDSTGAEVVDIVPNGPAAKAGIATGEKILQVGGHSASAMSLAEIMSEVDTSPGSAVDLVVSDKTGVARQLHLVSTSPTAFESSVDPETIFPIAVASEDRGGILVFKIPALVFGNTETAIKKSVKEFLKGGREPRGIVLDLRRSPSGDLGVAAEIADLFVDRSGWAFKTVGPHASEAYRVNPGSLVPEQVPLFVLVSHKTGGAGEALAAGLADLGRAKVIGEHTAGGVLPRVMLPIGRDLAVMIPVGSIIRVNGEDLYAGLNPDIKIDNTVDADAAIFSSVESAIRAQN